MSANRENPDRWKADIARSVDFYNEWFMQFAPLAFRQARRATAGEVADTLSWTSDLQQISGSILRAHPEALTSLRLATAPPLAADRLIGLAGVPRSMVNRMEREGELPPRMDPAQLEMNLDNLAQVIAKLADRDLFVWLDEHRSPNVSERERAIAVVSDRLSGATANPVIRNTQEKRQLQSIGSWLEEHGYQPITQEQRFNIDEMEPGAFRVQAQIPVNQQSGRAVRLPVDVAVMPKDAGRRDLPVLIEAKSAGDFANVNKRRKEEAAKVSQLRDTYGRNVSYVLFLCGYFDSGYLGYEAAEGIDWVWEHRPDDLLELGL